MPEDIQKPEETPRTEAERRAAERDAQLRAGVYVALAAATVVVLLTLGFLGRSGRVFAAGRALGLEDVALRLEQGRTDEAWQKLREIAPELRRMGWDTSFEVDAALRQIRRIDRKAHLQALRYLTGRELPEPPREEKPTPKTARPPVSPSAI